MKGQMTIFDFPSLIPDSLKQLEAPPFDKKLLMGIKEISDITPILPKYKIVLKQPDFKGRKEKLAVWVTYFHSISDSGWNYDLKDIESYEEIIMPEYTEYCTCFYELKEQKVYFYDEIKERTISTQKIEDKDIAVAAMKRWVYDAPSNIICQCLDKAK